MDVGEHWAYRARASDELKEVRIDAIGIKKPARAKVAFVADEFEGMTEWVPIGRLKSSWAERGEFLAGDLALRDVRESGGVMAAGESDATQYIFDLFIPAHVAWRGNSHKRGQDRVVAVVDWLELERITGLQREEFRHGPQVTVSGADLLPWPAAAHIAAAYASANWKAVWRQFGADTAQEGREHRVGRTSSGTRIDHELADRFLVEWQRMSDVIRSWIGYERAAEQDELAQAVETTRELVELLGWTTVELIRRRETRLAWDIHIALYPDASKKEWTPVLQADRAAKAVKIDEMLPNLSERRRRADPDRVALVTLIQRQQDLRWGDRSAIGPIRSGRERDK
jgi:hypothetical protein